MSATPDVSAIMAYEAGELDHEEVVELFQSGIDSGWVWVLQGSYGRTATGLIEEGFCNPAGGGK